MSTRTEELLTRCLRLEARVYALERAAIVDKRRNVTPDDIAAMRALLDKGQTRMDIARQTGWAYQTVWRYTHD